MADDTKLATLRSNVRLDSLQIKTPTCGPATQDATVEIAPAASIGSIYTMVRVPVQARISGLSMIYFDDLAGAGAPVLNIGIKPYGTTAFAQQLTALNDGIAVSAAAGSAKVVKLIENHGKMIWEFAGLTADPLGWADIVVSIATAASDTGGTLSMSLLYTVD